MTLLASRAQLRASLFRWVLFVVPVVLLLGFLSIQLAGSAASSPWFAGLVKPEIYPAPEVFKIIWPVLYVMIGIAAALVCAAWGARGRKAAIIAFIVQFVLGLAWSPVFFVMHEIQSGLILRGVTALAVLVTLVLFWRVRWQAGVLMLPFFAWALFTVVLNWHILELNPHADGAEVSGAVQRIEL